MCQLDWWKHKHAQLLLAKRSEMWLFNYCSAISSSIPTGIFRYFIITCHGTNVWAQTCLGTNLLGTNVSGHKRVWTQTCLGTNVCWHNHVWAQTCVGTNVCWHERVWAQTCVGTIMSGHKRVWAQTCLSTIMSGHNSPNHKTKFLTTTPSKGFLGTRLNSVAKFSPTKLRLAEFLTNKGINSYLLFTEGALNSSPTRRNLLLILEISHQLREIYY